MRVANVNVSDEIKQQAFVALEMWGEGYPYATIGRHLGVSRVTAMRRVALAEEIESRAEEAAR